MKSSQRDVALAVPAMALAGLELPLIGPIDGGTDSQEIGQRLVVATPDLLDCCELVYACEMRWNTLAERARGHAFSRQDRPRLESHVRELRSERVFAASHCASAGSSGFWLWQSDGVVRIYWTRQADEFEGWLRRSIPEYEAVPPR